MNEILLFLAACLAVATLLIHSIVGENRLITPLVKSNDGVMQADLAKQVIRFAWHFTSLLGLIAVYILFDAAQRFETADKMLLAITGGVFLLSGVYDAVVTKGRHIGWPFLFAIGILTIIAII
ncbi:hypothetical protein [Parasphingorhabdus halotolerans]|uniref:Small integral membrane protein n=1 Tax=Parasphingorhabdus halotolerans TaxID=2725558 RepID=A0A6H2DJ67_9SPHN|nr:hypothetical protein [Parasphingorhabdus halotolerans]QJB68374.1 hypothetical protein HF685_02860 [Parasphingorhabdus halotolerans]